jgi:pyridoxamine 5'-phosphate oxidase
MVIMTEKSRGQGADDVSPENTGFFDVSNPLILFNQWMKEARKSEPNDPDAMALATVDEAGMPNVRMVLLKAVDERGFVFYTNYESAKGEELQGQKKAAICFHWKSLRRQIRIRGDVESVSTEEADAYYNSRDRGSRIGAWASRQSRAMSDRFELEREVAKKAAKYAVGAVPRPPYWSGFRLVPVAIEFWRDKPFRLHDRRLFTRNSHAEPWSSEQLFP